MTWVKEIRDDVIEECNKHGGVLHVYVDQASTQGNVYVKCPSIATAVAAVNSLHGRWFAGRVITAAYVPVVNYHSLFPDALSANQLLMPSAPRRGMWLIIKLISNEPQIIFYFHNYKFTITI